MKNKLQGLLTGLVIGSLLTGSAAFAGHTAWLEAFYNDIKIVVDGNQITPRDAAGNYVEPFIVDGTTYLPVRAVGEALGKEVYWDGPNSTVYLGSRRGSLDEPTLRLEDAANIGNRAELCHGFTDNYGNSYNSALKARYYIGGYTMEYLLDMKYSKFSGSICVKAGDNKLNGLVVKFLADDRVVYTSPVVSKTSRPIPVDIDLRGCNDFKIELEIGGSGWNNGSGIYFCNCGFYQ